MLGSPVSLCRQASLPAKHGGEPVAPPQSVRPGQRLALHSGCPTTPGLGALRSWGRRVRTYSGSAT